MPPQISPRARKIVNLGTNLRLELIDDFLRTKPPVACLEIIAENFFSEGAHHRKLERLRADYDLTMHCLGMNIAGTDALDPAYLNRIHDLRQRYQPLHVSDHLCVEHHRGSYFHDLLPFPFTSASLRRVIERVARIQERLQENILLENLSYYVEFTENTIPEKDFIDAVCAETGAQILLDVNNLFVNQKNLGHDAAQFLADLDWTRVAEIHLAGGEMVNTTMVDSHGAKTPSAVLKLLPKHRIPQGVPIIYERDTNLLPYHELYTYLGALQEELSTT